MARFQPGEQISNFKIESLLGEGGFGETYRALDTELHRQVAIKCLREAVRHDTEIQGRFWREARAEARLTHPNVCTIFEVDVPNEIIVMELVDGETLEKRRENGPLDKNKLINIVIAGADAMLHAHKNQVLHRDLSLDNIMITASDHVKVLDFGLAKLTDESPLTEDAHFAGKRPYMSPEQQIRPKEVDPRSDVFSFGVVIYRLVTGQFPYPKTFWEDPQPGSPPPFESYGLDAWTDLYQVVSTALEVEPEDRFPTMEALREGLVGVRQALARVERSLHFFDTSTLLEVVCPPVPTPDGQKQAKRAQDHFEVQHQRESAVTSATVMLELFEQVAKLYFEAQDRGLNGDRVVQGVVTEAKREMGSRRTSWDRLGWDHKMRFVSGAKGLFRSRLETMASQLALLEADMKILVSKFLDFAVGLRLPDRDARVLADAFSLEAARMFSEETRYQGQPYRLVIQHVGENLYTFVAGTPQDAGHPSNPQEPSDATAPTASQTHA